MQLVELSPSWWAAPGRRGQGVVFLCPHCRTTWLCVPFANPVDGGAPWEVGGGQSLRISELWDILYGDTSEPAEHGVVRPGAVLPVGSAVVPPGCLWQRTGDTFEALSLSPSVDASRAGCWHGWLQAGQVT